MRFTFGLRGTFAACAFAASLAASALAAAPADLVVRGASIHTVDDAQPRATAFAVTGGRFVVVGNDAAVAPHIGPATRVLNLTSRTVVPGFNDAHLHPRPLFPEDSPFAPVDASPARVQSIDDLVAALRRKAALTPPGQWVTGARYQETKLGRHPTRADLDAATTEHPVSLSHSSGHQSVVNSLALRLAGITRDTPDPAGGHLVKDERGEPTGRLQESAQRLVSGVAAGRTPRAPAAETIAGLRARFADYAARGITSIGIAGGSPESGDEIARALGENPSLRVYQMLREDHADEAVRRMAAPSPAGVRYGGIKLFHGNSLSGQTCWVTEPYAGRPDYFGVPPARTQVQLDDLVLRLHRAGLQVCIHSNGDREIAMVLTAIERAQAAHPRPDARHRIEHCSIVDATLIARIKAAGVVPVPHAYLWEHGDKHEAYGAARWEWMHAARAFLDAGIPVASHSDAPVAEADALLRIQDLVTRRSAEGKVYGASQRISPTQALRIWTLGGAYATFEESQKGSITVGKFADFVVLGADPLAAPPDTIKDIAVELTVVGGRIVHDAAALRAATRSRTNALPAPLKP
jgi:predicted amidohydrolase YtcJ